MVIGLENRGERNIKALLTELTAGFPNSAKLKACSESVEKFKQDLPTADEIGFPVLLRLAPDACSIEVEYESNRGRYQRILEELHALAVQVSDHSVDHTVWHVGTFDGLKAATKDACEELDTFLTNVARYGTSRVIRHVILTLFIYLTLFVLLPLTQL